MTAEDKLAIDSLADATRSFHLEELSKLKSEATALRQSIKDLRIDIPEINQKVFSPVIPRTNQKSIVDWTKELAPRFEVFNTIDLKRKVVQSSGQIISRHRWSVILSILAKQKFIFKHPRFQAEVNTRDRVPV